MGAAKAASCAETAKRRSIEMSANLNNESHGNQSRSARPIRSQSAWRSSYYPDERNGQHGRRRSPNAFVAARMGYRSFD
jgi:hypothetical protein